MIWFILTLTLLIIIIYLLIKLITINKSIKEIESSLNFIIKGNTNSLITLSSNNKNLKRLCICLNDNLKELRKLEIEYKEGNQELKEWVTNISHDLRTPLTAIRGYLDLIDYSKLKGKQKEYLNYIDTKTKELTDLTEELFAFYYTLDSPKKQTTTCINTILESVICSLYSLFKTNDIIPSLDITKTKIIRNIDETSLKRIFENIITNAIKYGNKDIKIKLHDNGKIEFTNKAENLDTTSVKKIFDRFYTVENAKKKSGIGLSIAKQLVENNGGKINATYKNDTLKVVIELKNE